MHSCNVNCGLTSFVVQSKLNDNSSPLRTMITSVNIDSIMINLCLLLNLAEYPGPSSGEEFHEKSAETFK